MVKCSASDIPITASYLLVVFDAHADGVDEDGDHDASVEVLALHDAPELHPDLVPQPLAPPPGVAPPAFLPLSPAAASVPLPVRLLYLRLPRRLIGRSAVAGPRSSSGAERHGHGHVKCHWLGWGHMVGFVVVWAIGGWEGGEGGA